MMVVITYDVCTETKEGRTRLRKVAKQCMNYGIRVQNSVFECKVDAVQYILLKKTLIAIIDEKEDSLRFYRLGKSYKEQIEYYGNKKNVDIEGPLIF